MSERERLTRSELSWLLTQEARGAAERLRKGVQILTKAPPLPPERNPGSERPVMLSTTGEESDGLESQLELLEGTMQKLASIYGPSTQRGRRGRVDMAALIWEVAPAAQVKLAPGAGTEVFGDEAELRRMLHVLLGSSNHGLGGAQVIDLRREGDQVRLSVQLGPDTAPDSPAERGWLSRLAIRDGGRSELEGGNEVLSVPAEHAAEKKEIKELRRELEAAKAQGEAYARELAAVFAEPPSTSSRPPPLSSFPPGEGALGFLAPLARISDAIADDLRSMLAPLGAAKIRGQGRPPGDPSADPAAALHKETHDALTKGAELLALMRQVARTGGDIDRIPVDLAAVAHDEASLATVAFASRGVVLTSSISGTLMVEGMPSALRALVAEMLDRALRSNEPGGEVRIAVEGRALVVEGTETAAAVRSLREGGRAALVFLTEVARAHRITLRISDARLVAELPPED
ncbi:MAG: hypothetical protein NVS3B10_07940 [Polyangiales bacterium]